MMVRRPSILRCGIAVLLACPLASRAADHPNGSSVDVREGDTWSKATVIGSEGRRVHVKYDDGTDEWVGPDRLRDGAGGDATKPKRSLKAFFEHEQVEVKRNGTWMLAELTLIQRDWYFVVESGDRGASRWAEAWTLRVPGSAYDIDGEGTRSWDAHVGDPSPQKLPEKGPASVGDPFSAAPATQRAVTVKDLEENVEKLSFDDAKEPAAGAIVTPIPTTQPGSEFNSWALRGVDARLDRVALCPNNLTVAVASFPGQFGRWSNVIRTSLLDRHQLDTRPIRVPDVKILAAANAGDRLLGTQGWGRNLQLWTWSANDYHLVSNVSLDLSNAARIDDAQLLANDRAIVHDSGGTTFLIDLAGKRVLSSIKGSSDARVSLHPSGVLTGVIDADGNATVLRSDDFTIVAQLPDAAGRSNLAIDPTGRFAAYLTRDGSVRIVRLADGSRIGLVWAGIAFKGRLDLIDDKCLLVDGKVAYDVKSGVPIWTYKTPAGATFTPLANGQLLIAEPRDKMAALAIASLPDAAARAAARAIDLKQFILTPGTAVTVDDDFAFLGTERDQGQAAVADLVAGAGLKLVTSDEPFHLKFTSAAGPSETRDYAPDLFTPPPRIATSVNVTSTIVTATLTYKGQPVWTQELKFGAGDSLAHDATHTLQQSADEAAKPKASALRDVALPSFLRADAKPGTPVTFGVSTLQDHRFAPDVSAGKTMTTPSGGPKSARKG